jgi:hypothetical protein
MQLYKETGRFPTNKEILRWAGVGQIGGVTYFVDYMRTRLENRKPQYQSEAQALTGNEMEIVSVTEISED